MKIRVERQTTTSSHVRVRHARETYSFNSFNASVSTSNHHIFTHFVQRRSFLSSCYHLNLKQAFKVKNLVPMTMHHSRCHWSRALYQVLMRMLMPKKPLFRIATLRFSRNKTDCSHRHLFSRDFQKYPTFAFPGSKGPHLAKRKKRNSY